ncbi:MAG: UPF0236 family protein, partial [Firmicutes bacterium]|nr:UPF0236 family protein [Bacillota bacterium]
MDTILDEGAITFLSLETIMVRFLAGVFTDAMKVVLKRIDDRLFRERDKSRYEELDFHDRTFDTIFGVPLTFRRRYYRGRETGENVFLLDEAMGLDAGTRLSPLLKEAAVIAAVRGPSYRAAAESLKQLAGGKVLSHESVRQCAKKAGLAVDAMEAKARKEAEGDREAPIAFLEVDGVNMRLQQADARLVEERALTAHEGWDPRPGCRKEARLRGGTVYSSHAPGEWREEASRHVYSWFRVKQDTIAAVNGDRAPWIRQGTEWFGSNTVLCRIDRCHLKRDLAKIFKDKEVLARVLGKADADPTGALFVAALAEERVHAGPKGRA